ncbi:hypothetical protein [Aerosticca soli]|uniref:hypothetical protein n=1 Tax=Aerosticca soli TaxID=2010829 RepID=UPI000F83FF79|nr:hypothetical protein [Aerosticca soli]
MPKHTSEEAFETGIEADQLFFDQVIEAASQGEALSRPAGWRENAASRFVIHPCGALRNGRFGGRRG